MTINDGFGTMKELGQQLGLTSHQVGKLLKQLGYRTPDGKPSAIAFALKMVQQRFAYGSNEHYCWAWSFVHILPLLREMLAQGQANEAISK